MPDRVVLVADQQHADAAIQLGQHHLHGEVLGGEALDVGGPLRLGAAALQQLEHRGVDAGKRVLLVVEAIQPKGEAGEVEDDAGRVGGENRLHEADAGAFFQGRDDNGHRVEGSRLELGDQRFERRGAGPLEGSAIEQDRHVRVRRGGQLVEHAVRGVPEAEAVEGFGGRTARFERGASPTLDPSPRGGGRRLRQSCEGRQQRIGVFRAAGGEQAMEPGPVIGVDGGPLLQDRIRVGVAGEQGQPDAAAQCQGGEFVDTVLPVGRAAEQPDHHQLRVLHGLIEPQVDREVVAQPHEIGEPQVGGAGAVGGPGQHHQFAVGSRGEDDRRRGLGEVDGLAFLLQGAGLGGEQVHHAGNELR